MSKLTIRCKRPLAFLLTLLLTVMIFPVAGPADSVSACHLVRIEVRPETATILAGEDVTYTAEAFDENDNTMGDVTTDTDFSIESGAGGSWSPHNTYHSENAGTWVVTGEYEGKMDTATLIVEPISGSISGIVFEDINGNGVQDGVEAGIGGVEVTLDGTVTVTTAGGGIYSFSGVAAGSHSVESAVPAGHVATTPNPVMVTVVAGDTATADDIGFQGRGIISGIVFEDINGNGTQDGVEAGIDGVTVTLDGTVTVTTAGDGSYSFSGVAAGSHSVESAVPAGHVATTANPVVGVNVTAGGTATVDFGFQGYGSIEGIVFEDINGNGTQDGVEAGIGGVEVTLDGTVTVTTAGDGSYSFSGVAAGEHDVESAVPAGHAATTANPVTGVNVTAGGTATVDFGFQGRGITSGVVFNDIDGDGVQGSGEAGIDGVTVTLDGTVTTVTAGGGIYSFSDVAAGEHDVESAVPAGYVATTANPVTGINVTAGGTATADFGFQGQADLSITKTDGDIDAVAGEDLTYTIEVTNNGPVDATGVIVTDTLPLGVSFKSASQPVTQDNRVITWNAGSLGNGASATLIIVVTVDPSTRDSLYNEVEVDGVEYDPDTDNNSADVTTIVYAVTDLSITKTDTTFHPVAGEDLTYLIEVTNNGPSDATGVVVVDNLPDGVSFLFATEPVTLGSDSVEWDVGTLGSGDSAMLTIVVTVFPETMGPLSNTAFVYGGETDPNPDNNTVTEVTEVYIEADLWITKSADETMVAAGEDLTYTIEVTNLGPSYAGSVTVTDTLPLDVKYESANASIGIVSEQDGVVTWYLGLGYNESATLDIDVTVDPAARWSVSNSATVFFEHDPNPSNNTATVYTDIIVVADLSVTKSDSPDPVTPNSELTYTIIVTNNGPSDDNGGYVQDDIYVSSYLEDDVTFQSATPSQGSINWESNSSGYAVGWDVGSLASGASATLTVVLFVDYTYGTFDSETQEKITNEVHVYSLEGDDPDPFNNSASEDTWILHEVDLMVTKSDNPDPVARGSELTYTIIATNNGPEYCLNVQVNDFLPSDTEYKSSTASRGHVEPPISGNLLVWVIGDMAPDESATLTILVTVLPTAPGMITNSAEVYSASYDHDPVPSNDIATAETSIAVVDHIIISPDFDTITAGESLAYTAEAFDEHGVSVGDVTAATSFSITPGAQGSWSANEYTSEKAGTWTVTGNYDGKEAYATLVVKSGLHSDFVFDTISSSQIAGVPFSITVTAVDEYDNVVSSYVGTADLSDLSGTVNPATTTNFAIGVWTGNVSIGTAFINDTITATDTVDSEITGTSNEFDVDAEEPAIDIEKHTNGEDADEPTGPELVVGDPVQWSYTVTNTGNVPLYNITVTDDTGFVVPFPVDTLLPGESDTALVNGTVALGQYENVGHVTATSPLGTEVSDDDPSHYLGVPSGPAVRLDLTPDGDTVAIGAPFTVTVTAYDSEGRIAEGYTGTVHFTSSDGGAGLPVDYTFTTADAGVHVFTGGVTLAATGDQTVTATDTIDSPLTDTETFDGWDPYEVDYIVISPASETIIAGQDQDYTVEAYNQYGYPLGDVTSGTAFSIEPGAGGSWSVGTYTSQNPGTWTVTATFQGKEDMAELGVTREPVDYIVISPHNAAINAGDTQPYTAEAFDEYGISLGDVTPATVFSIAPGAQGSWSANVYTSEKSGSWTVTGTYGTKSDDERLIVKSGPHSGFSFAPISSPQIAGVPFSITITAVDDYENTVSTYFGTASLTDLSGTITPATTASFASGVWTGDVTIAVAQGDDIITATDGDITGDSNEFDVEPGSIVSGFVFNDTNRNGVRDSGEAGLAGVTVELIQGEVTRTTLTDGDGNYSFDDVAPGIYRVVETNPTGYVSTTADDVHIDVVLTEDEQVDFGDVLSGPEDPAVIYGVVFNDVDGNGGQDDDELGIPGVTVTLDDTTPATSTTTNEFGQYTFSVDTAGIHTVVETDPAGYFSTTPNERHVDVALGNSYQVDFGDALTDSAFAGIYGTVFDDINGNRIWDNNEIGIPDVIVTLDATTSVTTDKYGGYTFRVESAGVHTVVETDPAGYFSTTPNEVRVGVTLGESYQVDFGDASTDSEFAVILGTVFDDVNGNEDWDAGEVGIPGVTVTLDDTTPTTTDSFGRYTFRLGAASIHTVVETDPAGYTSTTPNDVDVDVLILGGSYQVDFGDRIPLPPPPGPLSYIVISPDTASVTAGDTQAYTAEAFDEDDISLGDVTSVTTFSIESGAGGGWSDNTYTSEHAGEWTVTGTHNEKSDTATLGVTAGPHYSFQFSHVSSPQVVGVPFSITITAVDQYGNTAASYSGTAALADLSGTVTPTSTTGFSNGTWTGDITVATVYATDFVTAVDTGDSNISGASNAFNVVDGTGTVVEAEVFTVDFLGKITNVPISDSGELLNTMEAPSPDGSHLLKIQQGTIVTDSEGNVVTLIEITEAVNPGLPVDTTLLGNAYDFQPSGSSFSIRASITLGYEVNDLPPNVIAVALAYYTDGLGWTESVPQGGVVAELGKETAEVEHFTIFAVLARTASGSAPSIDQPVADFVLSNLVITPSVSEIWEFLTFVVTEGEEAAITVEVSNIGGKSGYYTAFLTLDGTIVATQKISLNPGQTEEIIFNVGPNEPGTYQVEIGGLSGEFESSVWINWGVILGLPAGLILLALILWYLRKRQKAQAG